MNDIDTLIKKGCDLSADGKHQEAHEVFVQACSVAPDSIPAWCNRGNTAFLLSDIKDGEAAYRHALSLNAENPMAHIGMARVAMMKKDWPDVIERLEALASDAHRDRNYLLGIAYEQLKDVEHATQAYKASVEHGHQHARNALMRLYMTSNQPRQLADMLNEANQPDYHIITALFHGLGSAKSRWTFLNACSDIIKNSVTIYDIAAGAFLLKQEYAYAARTFAAASRKFSDVELNESSSLKECAWF